MFLYKIYHFYPLAGAYYIPYLVPDSCKAKRGSSMQHRDFADVQLHRVPCALQCLGSLDVPT